MKVVITGGGTGGHVFPGIAVAQALKSHEIIYAGSPQGFEKAVTEKYHVPFYPIVSRGIAGKGILGKIKSLFITGLGYLQAVQFLVRFRPQVVIGTGGYASSPVLLAASSLRIPSLMLEQNVLPGKTTRLLSRFVSCVLVSFEESKTYLPNANVVVTGNPVRPEIGSFSKTDGCEHLGLRGDWPLILVMGASQGARSINEALLAALPSLREKPWQVIHLTGKRHFESIHKNALELLKNATLIYRPIAFSDEMADLLAASDLVVSRAGATSLAEIMQAGKASILIPYPFAAENHQEINARWLEKNGDAQVILDKALTGEVLRQNLERLLNDPQTLKKMGESARRSARPDALHSILKVVEEVSGVSA